MSDSDNIIDRPCGGDSCEGCLPHGLCALRVARACPDGLNQATVAALLGVRQQSLFALEKRLLARLKNAPIAQGSR